MEHSFTLVFMERFTFLSVFVPAEKTSLGLTAPPTGYDIVVKKILYGSVWFFLPFSCLVEIYRLGGELDDSVSSWSFAASVTAVECARVWCGDPDPLSQSTDRIVTR